MSCCAQLCERFQEDPERAECAIDMFGPPVSELFFFNPSRRDFTLYKTRGFPASPPASTEPCSAENANARGSGARLSPRHSSPSLRPIVAEFESPATSRSEKSTKYGSSSARSKESPAAQARRQPGAERRGRSPTSDVCFSLERDVEHLVLGLQRKGETGGAAGLQEGGRTSDPVRRYHASRDSHGCST